MPEAGVLFSDTIQKLSRSTEMDRMAQAGGSMVFAYVYTRRRTPLAHTHSRPVHPLEPRDFDGKVRAILSNILRP
jgi:hypothetical protein